MRCETCERSPHPGLLPAGNAPGQYRLCPDCGGTATQHCCDGPVPQASEIGNTGGAAPAGPRCPACRHPLIYVADLDSYECDNLGCDHYAG